jgi:hypothetical protein
MHDIAYVPVGSDAGLPTWMNIQAAPEHPEEPVNVTETPRPPHGRRSDDCPDTLHFSFSSELLGDHFGLAVDRVRIVFFWTRRDETGPADELGGSHDQTLYTDGFCSSMENILGALGVLWVSVQGIVSCCISSGRQVNDMGWVKSLETYLEIFGVQDVATFPPTPLPRIERPRQVQVAYISATVDGDFDQVRADET